MNSTPDTSADPAGGPLPSRPSLIPAMIFVSGAGAALATSSVADIDVALAVFGIVTNVGWELWKIYGKHHRTEL
ncbi:hypothetical protein [Nocardia abscessus]|uniref:hypothetical protein n=1 Tax=Nocardia abscessus TaxID=120957 RepID=UPI00031E57EE|nr:hypothetical protein [Nocardia abscessus]MCC3332057.1 hypothetical protein [Nocardia abscessus]